MGDSLIAKSLDAWTAALRAAHQADLRPDQGVFAAPLPLDVAAAREADFQAAGWRMDGRSGYDSRDAVATVDISPMRGHQAMFVPHLLGGANLWLDGGLVAVTRDADGATQLDHRGDWLSERFFYCPVGGLWAHPRQGPLTLNPLGTVFGVLLCDLQQGTTQVVLPPPDQAWTFPVMSESQGELQLFADRAAQAAGQVAWGTPANPPG